jgi:metal-dependent amidase/aminoacylase/carboxypeptidase family protein
VGEVAFGTSPGYGEIMVTLRAFVDDDMSVLSQKTIELARTTGHKHNLAVETSFTDDFPAAVCDPKLTMLVENLAVEQSRKIVYLEEPNRWSEDFSHFTITTPSILFGLGVGENVPELHNPDYDFPDEALEHGVRILNAIIDKLLR